MANRLQIEEKLDALNHLIAHLNAAIDLLASDKRTELATNLGLVAELIHNGELMEVMDYGDQISLNWTQNQTEYAMPFDLCHVENAYLEDGESIPVADFESHYTLPSGVLFDEVEAIFASNNAKAAGTYYFTVENDAWGGNNGKNFQFTLPQELPAGYQIRKSGGYNANLLNCTLDVYENGSSRTKLYSMTPTEGNSGTFLGKTDGTGDLNHWHRVALGYNRWSQSFLRQYLNATGAAGTYYVQQNKWDVKPAVADTLAGFLNGFDESLLQFMKQTQIKTVTCNADGNVIDTTYDRVFLSSLEQMYCVPQFPGEEGEYWEYYKRLLGRTAPAPTGVTYTRLIKYGLNAKTSAQYWFRRSAYRSNACYVWSVDSSGYVSNNSATSGHRCAPCLRISL